MGEFMPYNSKLDARGGKLQVSDIVLQVSDIVRCFKALAPLIKLYLSQVLNN